MQACQDLDTFLLKAREEIDRALDRLIPAPGSADFGGRLFAAMRHSLFSGGKRLRPALCLLVNQSLGGDIRKAVPAGCALEMIHTYSLIHDDLPAMDDDDLRRGEPSCHKAFDEATAILAGDALLTHAFEAVAAGMESSAEAVRVIGILSRAAGPRGMVLGQMRDLISEGRDALSGEKKIDIDTIRAIHSTKTAAMFSAAFEAGAVTASAERDLQERLAEAGLRFGLTFQIVDDILDVVGTTSRLGKTVGKDEASGKATYPSLIGLEASRREAEKLTAEALALLPGGSSFQLLGELAERMLARTY